MDYHHLGYLTNGLGCADFFLGGSPAHEPTVGHATYAYNKQTETGHTGNNPSWLPPKT